VTIALLILAVIVLAVLTLAAWTAASRARTDLAIYRSTHLHTTSDLEAARADSISRSRSTVSGQITEHLAPFFPELLAEFNPRDARFIGTPVDFVIFDGLDEGSEICDVVFVEVKTGKSGLNTRERKVRDAIRAGRVGWRLVRLNAEPAGLPTPPEARQIGNHILP
jgi:hypothetical protein